MTTHTLPPAPAWATESTLDASYYSHETRVSDDVPHSRVDRDGTAGETSIDVGPDGWPRTAALARALAAELVRAAQMVQAE
jgi:hypothetical protein